MSFVHPILISLLKSQNLTSRQDDALGLEGELSQLGRARQHLGVDIEATQAAQDQVAGLAAKVEHQNGL